MILRSSADLQSWLTDNAWLQDAVVERLDPPTTSGLGSSLPGSVRLSLWIQVGGSYRAGEQRVVRQLELRAMDIQHYSVSESGYVPGHCCEGAEVLEHSPALAFELDVPGALQLRCSRIEVHEVERVETVPARFSEWGFHAQFPGPPPSPTEWCQLFSGYSVAVTWRYYGGPPVEPDSVPADYTGWFIETVERVPMTAGGLFVYSYRDARPGGITLELNEPGARVLWVVAGAIVSEIPGVEVHCGNVTLTGAAWREHLASTYPALEELCRSARGA
ncbi:hypothetical protein [Sorangium sp. So ce1097]|uniref:hypothetical protein n=1 Tax=Sorangium sp. So ce1097 TaxID=3133330 RepID=UPI003F5F1D9B